MKKIDPTMLMAAIHQSVDVRCTHTALWHTTHNAISLATRKQMEPTKSGVQMRRFCWCTLNPVFMRFEGVDVEPQGADRLDDGGPPVGVASAARP